MKRVIKGWGHSELLKKGWEKTPNYRSFLIHLLSKKKGWYKPEYAVKVKVTIEL